ncbi:hypothetical protein E3Q13_03136 [Wallemia mellicola]|nr:hypothetical protein E3Q13_03136 [Wallemia mellicola]
MYGRDLVVQFGQDRSEQKKRKYDKEAEKEDTNERPDNRKPKRAKPGAALANAQRSEKASGAINQPSAGIVEDLVGKATGINVTQKIEEQNKLSEYAHNINDSQWKLLVENSNQDNVWLILITSGKQDEFERLLKESFNNLAEETRDDDNIKLGRADYGNDIRSLSTRWLLFQVPIYVFTDDNGRTLRFMSPYHYTPSSTNLRKLLLEKGYKDLPIWDSEFSYEGKYARYMDVYTNLSLYLHSKLDVIPSIVWYIGIASASSSLLKWMHKDDKKNLARQKGSAEKDNASAHTRSKTAVK